MKLKKLIKRRMVIFLIFILLIALIGYLFLNSYVIYETASHDYKAEAVDAMGQRINSLFLEINDFPRDEGGDILYLGKSNDLRRFINSESDMKKLKEEVEEDFLSFMEVSKVYYQLRYIDENGYEIIRTEFDGESSFIVEEEDLQYKGDRYYFKEAMMLGKEEIYVSRLDLNIEENVLENRGTIAYPEYVPIIRYALPVFDDSENRRGIVVLNVYADYFLEDIRRLVKDGEISFLVDNEGYYLAHPDKGKEFSFMFDSSENIFNDYGEDVGIVLDSFNLRNYEDENYIFTFRHLYPTIGTFAMYKGSERVFGEDPEKEYYWVLIRVSDRELMNQNIRAMKSKFVIFVLFSTLLIMFIFVLLAIVLVMNGRLK